MTRRLSLTMAVAVTTALEIAACGEAEQGLALHSPQKSVVVARRRPFEKKIFVTGELDAAESVRLNAPRTDAWRLTILWIAENGAKVAQGDRVIEFDTSTQTQDLETKKAQVREARRAAAAAQQSRTLTIAEEENKVRIASLERDKAALLARVDRDLVAERDYQERQLALQRANAHLSSAQARLLSVRKTARLDIRLAKISLESAERTLAEAERSIAAMTIRAPKSGVVMVGNLPWSTKKIMAGDEVEPGWTVVTLPNMHNLVVRAHLSDVDDGEVALGMRARVSFDRDAHRVLTGTVAELGALARELEHESPRRAFDLLVTLEEVGTGWALPGMSARVEIVTMEIEDALLVPRAAIHWRGRQAWVSPDGDHEARPIEVTDCNAQACVASSGITTDTPVRAVRTGADR